MVQKLASEFFWPRFQKQDGRHGRFIQIFRDFCCPSISKGMQCTLSKFAGYVHPWELFWISGQKQDGHCGFFFDRFFTKYKKCKYLENLKR